MKIRIDPARDATALGVELRQRRRLQVPGFFPDDVAEELYALLNANSLWYTTYNDGDQHYEIPPEGMAAMNETQRQRFQARLMRGAQRGFQYCFQQYDITGSIKRGEHLDQPLNLMHEFVNDVTFIDYMRRLTDDQTGIRADCYASRYLPGHFLTQHNDVHDADDRVAAYVISMTKDWRADWGGLLLFFDDAGKVTEGFVPSFNTLNIFLVPQAHAVSFVAPFAGQVRTSFLGWVKR